MEKFVQREKVLVQYAEKSPKSPYRSSEDTDFNDVFGGPPRRFSMQEVRVRYSFGETVDSEEEKASSPWIVLNEKPVFGEETGTRSRRKGNDFYNDIFGGDESYSSPRKSDRDGDSLFRSSSGSRIMSPARPLPPKSELFGTSLPSQFSLSSKLTKAKELPAFGSKSPLSPSTSRFSSETIQGLDEIRNEIHPVFRPSPLSHETSFGSEDFPTSDQRGKNEKLKKEPKNVENDENEFHFSIYKWAGLGVPMLISLLCRNNSKSKDINGNCIEPQEKDWRMKEEEKEQLSSTEVALDEILESKVGSKEKYTVGFDGARINLKSEKDNSLDVTDKNEEAQKEFPPGIKKSPMSELKPPHPFPDDVVKQTGNVKDVKENKSQIRKGAKSNEHGRKNVKQKEETRINSNRENADEPSLQGETKISGATPGKRGVRGKVREFVNIFSNETDSKPKADVKTRSQRFRWKAVGIDQKEDKVSLNEDKVIENVNLNNVEKKPDVSPKGDENIKKNEAHEYSSTKTSSHRSENFSCNQDTEFLSESLDRDSKISQDYVDESFEDMFQVEELFEDHVELTQSNEVSEDLKVLEAKIQKWSFGKKGNIRSLLSTLQFVLWPESGWTPVPLMDLIEANSVKRAYQKALLRLHPDKLQQKGAEASQKYIAEKVFDILQEAWDRFNTLTPLTLS